MATRAREQVFNGSLTTTSVYDPDQITITGSLVRQQSLSASPEDKFLGPIPNGILRAFNNTGTGVIGMDVLKYGSLHYIFGGQSANAGATRFVALWTYNPSNGVTQYLGTITLTYPTTTGHNMRGIRAVLRNYTTGTIAVSGTAVTGTGTQWLTDRQTVGSRIGFGSTNPQSITTWYEISAIGSNTSITLTASAGTITAGTPYVIENFSIVTVTSNATLTNGGLFVAKGLRLDMFGGAGSTVPAATTVDNIRAVYRLKDAATIVNQLPNSTATGAFVDWQTEYAYVGNGQGTALQMFRYNIRAALTHTTGDGAVLTGSDIVATGIQNVPGNLVSNQSSCIATASHGPGSGVESIYMTTAARVLRIPTANITAGSTTYIADQMVEVAYGGPTNVPATGAMGPVTYASSIDKFLITSFANNNARLYVTQFRTDAGQADDQMLTINQSYDDAATNTPLFPKFFGQLCMEAFEGVLYLTVSGGTAASNGNIYIYPAFAADWDYTATTGNRAILPRINLGATPTAFRRVYASAQQYIATLPNLLKTTEPFRLLYRTAGISDNSGAWTTVPQSGVLSGVNPASEIQFAVEFHTIGDLCVPARLNAITLVYDETDALPDEFQWNVGDFDIPTGTFAWIQTGALASWPATFTISIYRADTNALVLQQDSTGSLLGNFQTWNGSTWAAGLGTNTVGQRRRFVPSSSLPGGVDLYATVSVV